MKNKLVVELINYFLKENNKLENISIPDTYEEKRVLLRGIINIREPIYTPNYIIEKENKLLQLELKKKNVIDVNNINEIEKNICLWLGDITTIKCDLIVNAGNEYGLGCFVPSHKCIDNEIHSKSGILLRKECNDILKGNILEVGNIIVCNGYNLPCKKVITTVGPQIYDEITKEDEESLALCYQNSLKYAVKNKYTSIVFPSISTGLYGYPIKKAKYIAYSTVKEFLKTNNIKVVFDVFSEEDYNEYRSLFQD